MIKTLSGKDYKITKMMAYYAKEYIESKDESLLFKCISVKTPDGWVNLAEPELIDFHVATWMDLSELLDSVIEHNLGFLENRRFRRLPDSGISSASPYHCDPLFHALVSNKYADMTELKQSLTLEDAFDLLDSLTTSKLNEYYALQASKRG